MKQSEKLISERRVRAAILTAYDEYNPDNKPREISNSIITALDEAIKELIIDIAKQAPCNNGRVSFSGYFCTEYLPGPE